MGAVIQADHDIRAVAQLELDGLFWGQQIFAVAAFRLEAEPLFVQAAKFGFCRISE